MAKKVHSHVKPYAPKREVLKALESTGRTGEGFVRGKFLKKGIQT